MNDAASQAKKRRWRPTQRQWLAAGLAVLGTAALAAGSYYVWLTTPPPLPTTAAEAVDMLKSPRYQRLPEQRRLDYMEHARTLWGELSNEQRRDLFRQMRQDEQARDAFRQAMSDQMAAQARQFVLADEAERRQILDKVIGMQQMARERWQQRSGEARTRPDRPPGSGQPGGGAAAGPAAGGDNPQRPADSDAERQAQRQNRRAERQKMMQNRIERGDPQRQAYMAEFFKALRKRRAELGMSPDFRPGGRRGGGRG